MSDDPTTDDELPERLVRALRHAHPRAAPPSAERERALFAAARARLATPVRPARALPRVAAWMPLGLAAAVLVAWLFLGGSRDALDLDGSGRVDVLDAFALARGVRDGAPRPAWDVDGDGRVDERDVDVVLAAAVRIGP